MTKEQPRGKYLEHKKRPANLIDKYVKKISEINNCIKKQIGINGILSPKVSNEVYRDEILFRNKKNNLIEEAKTHDAFKIKLKNNNEIKIINNIKNNTNKTQIISSVDNNTNNLKNKSNLNIENKKIIPRPFSSFPLKSKSSINITKKKDIYKPFNLTSKENLLNDPQYYKLLKKNLNFSKQLKKQNLSSKNIENFLKNNEDINLNIKNIEKTKKLFLSKTQSDIFFLKDTNKNFVNNIFKRRIKICKDNLSFFENKNFSILPKKKISLINHSSIKYDIINPGIKGLFLTKEEILLKNKLNIDKQ